MMLSASSNFRLPRMRALWVAAALASTATASHALFADDEARRAILEVRQRVDVLQQSQGEEFAQMRRNMLDLQEQIESVRKDNARLTGQNEQLARELAELQRKQKDIAQGVDERLRQFEPVQVSLDGMQFSADPAEKRDYEAALAQFRSGDYPQARKSFAAFVNTHAKSGYMPSVRFLLASTQYAGRDCKEAIANFRSMLNAAPQHPKAPEAMLSTANCQIELKDTAAARKTFNDLVAAHPNSEAAALAKDSLARLK